MLPAHKGFKTGNGAFIKLDDRLVDEADLVALQRTPQIGFQLKLVATDGSECRTEWLDAIASETLCLIHGKLGVLHEVLGSRCRFCPCNQADGRCENDFSFRIGNRSPHGLAESFGERGDAPRIAFGGQQQAELVGREARECILRLHEARQTSRNGEQDRVACRHAKAVIDLLEAVYIDDEHGWMEIALATGHVHDIAETVEEQLAIWKAGQIVMHGVVQQAFFCLFLLRHIDERSDTTHHFAIRADDRAGAKRIPVIVTVIGAKPENLADASAPVFQNGVERRAEPVTVIGMHGGKPVAHRALQAAGGIAEIIGDIRCRYHAVARHVPIPYDVSRTDDGESLSLHVG